MGATNLRITAKFVMISPKKANGPMRVKRNPQNSPIILIPQDAGLVGGSLPGEKKGKNEANQFCVVYGVFGTTRMKYAGPVEQLPLL